jgi:hypothetical protein
MSYECELCNLISSGVECANPGCQKNNQRQQCGYCRCYSNNRLGGCGNPGCPTNNPDMLISPFADSQKRGGGVQPPGRLLPNWKHNDVGSPVLTQRRGTLNPMSPEFIPQRRMEAPTLMKKLEPVNLTSPNTPGRRWAVYPGGVSMTGRHRQKSGSPRPLCGEGGSGVRGNRPVATWISTQQCNKCGYISVYSIGNHRKRHECANCKDLSKITQKHNTQKSVFASTGGVDRLVCTIGDSYSNRTKEIELKRLYPVLYKLLVQVRVEGGNAWTPFDCAEVGALVNLLLYEERGNVNVGNYRFRKAVGEYGYMEGPCVYCESWLMPAERNGLYKIKEEYVGRGADPQSPPSLDDKTFPAL